MSGNPKLSALLSLWSHRLEKALELANDCLFPIRCLSCGCHDEWICPACLEKIRIRLYHQCPFCRIDSPAGRTCDDCREGRLLDGLWIAGHYQDALLSKAIKSMKYAFAKDIADPMSFLMAGFLERNGLADPESGKFGSWPMSQVILVPVPLHPARYRWRGFNQSAEIAKRLGERYGLAVDTESLRRIKRTVAQTSFSKEKRIRNLKDAFAWQGSSLAGKRLIIIDDVYTSGATLESCAKALRKSQAKSIWGLVLARN
jgi:ComF family protein